MNVTSTAMLVVLGGAAVAADPGPERLLVLLDGGPVVVDVHLELDGRPYREGRAALVADLLRMADSDGDGRPTWGEAVLNPRFPTARRTIVRNGRATSLTGGPAAFDDNENEIVDRSEAEALVTQLGGPALVIAADRSRVPTLRTETLIDADGNGTLDADELNGAGNRLLRYDTNDDGVIDLLEVATYNRPVQGRGGPAVDPRGSSPTVVTGVIRLDGTTKPFPLLAARYSRVVQRVPQPIATRSLPLVPEFATALDADADGLIDGRECAALATVAPHLELRVSVGKVEETSITVSAARAPFDEAAEGAGQGTRFEASLPTTSFSVEAAGDRAAVDYTQTAKTLLARVDLDGNGYVDRKEVEGRQQAAYFLRQFDAWDENEDGKVYADEIKAAYDRQYAPRRTQVVLTVGRATPSLFDALDANGDRRLGERELANVAETFDELDRDGDGVLSPTERPGRFTVAFGRQGAYVPRRLGGGVVARIGSNGRPVANGRGPKWFAHADVNGDGDLSPREFLGTPEQFERFDTNGDGFLDVDEASAVE